MKLLFSFLIVALFFSKLYSARLFKTETSAIFCMCLYQPEYMQVYNNNAK